MGSFLNKLFKVDERYLKKIEKRAEAVLALEEEYAALSEEELSYEINQDVYNLECIFKRKINGFAVPFTECNEREIDIIRRNTKIEFMRLSCYASDFCFHCSRIDFVHPLPFEKGQTLVPCKVEEIR